MSAMRLELFFFQRIFGIVTMIALPVALATMARGNKVADKQMNFWREKLPSVQVPESVAASMSPLTKEEANALATIITDGNLQPHATQFCKAANLQCQEPILVITPNKNKHIKVENDDLELTEVRGMFFTPEELKEGGRITLTGQIYRPWNAFLPSDLSELIPFSTSALPHVLSSIGIPERSNMSMNMGMTLSTCEAKPDEGESKKCTKSIEGMIEYVVSYLGSSDNVELFSHPLPTADDTGKKARVRNVVQRLSGNLAPLSCHRMVYPYGVFYCHSIEGTLAYTFELEVLKNNGNVYNATALCHPGEKNKESVYCHLILGDTLLWLPKDNH